MDTALLEELAAAANSLVAVAAEECSAEVLGLDMPAVVNMALVVAAPDDIASATAATVDATDQVSVEADDAGVLPVLGFHNSTTKLGLLTEAIFVFVTMGMRVDSAWQKLTADGLASRTRDNTVHLVLVWAI